jgi:hypothetical protein
MIPDAPSLPPVEPPPSGIKIHNWRDANDPIHDNTELIRYMKLSTFLLLLDNRLFIPSVRLLQATDRFEAKIPQWCCGQSHRYEDMMWNHVFGGDPHENWLFKAAGVQPVLRKKTGPHELRTLEFLTETWLAQMARRRCVWCWDRSTEQLHAMWKLYGERGVAVFSTVGKIRKALEKAGAQQGIASPVRYVPLPSLRRLEDISRQYGLMSPENLSRPHLFKDAGFRIEDEVRFVLRANPIAIDAFRGITVNIDAKSIFDDFELSREIPAEERRTIKLLARERLDAPAKPPSPDDEPVFPECEPFLTEPDLPNRMFPDLDR